MYCKKCGKEIAEESTFCSYCGEKQQIVLSPNNNDGSEIEKSIDGAPSKTTPIDNRSNANIFADEIIANLKMVGLALLLSGIFTGLFWCYHIKDRKPISENYYGYSCYDLEMQRYYITNWEKVYSAFTNSPSLIDILLTRKDRKQWLERHIGKLQKYDNYAFNYQGQFNERGIERLFRNSMFIHQFENDIKLDSLKKLSPEDRDILLVNKRIEKTDEELVIEAKRIASDNKEFFETEINDKRQCLAKDDMKDHFKYSIFISLSLTLLGRYVIKGIKWVAKNRTNSEK